MLATEDGVPSMQQTETQVGNESRDLQTADVMQIWQVTAEDSPQKYREACLTCVPGPRSEAEGWIQPSSMDGVELSLYTMVPVRWDLPRMFWPCELPCHYKVGLIVLGLEIWFGG